MTGNLKIENTVVDQVRKLIDHTVVGLYATAINSVILSVVLWHVIPKTRIMVWLALMLSLSLVRMIVYKQAKKIFLSIDNIHKWKWVFLIGIGVTGCLWGAAGILFLPYASLPYQVLILFVLGGMVAGSVGPFSSLMTAFHLFSVPVLAPVIVLFFQFNDTLHSSMAIMILIFWVLMHFTARQLNKESLWLFNLKYENLDLIASLEMEIRDRKIAEEKLLTRNQEIEAIVENRTAELRQLNKRHMLEIEERKIIEKALRESEMKYRELANSLPQVIFETDAQGRIAFTNQNGIKMLGYDMADSDKGLNVFEMLVPEDRDRARADFQKILGGAKTESVEYTALRKDGGAFPVALHSAPVFRDHKPDGIRGIIIDLSSQKRSEEEQKNLEAQLQRAQKMEVLGTMAGGVAHDLNNVLSGIVSYPDLLLMQIPQDSPLRKPILIMQESGLRAAAIVQDLLTLTRRGVVTEEVVNLNSVVKNYLESPEHDKLISFHKAARISFCLEDDLLNILGSPVHLSKTVMNLVSNGVEALPDGGEVIISTVNRYLDRPVRGYDDIKEGDYVVLTVSDTGVGIAPQDLERIFEPFFTKKVMGRSGTGLGMAVVWGTVRDHKGYIDAVSHEGTGSTFSLFFPVTRKHSSKDAISGPVESLWGKGESILVVDDVKEQREIADDLMSSIGYSITTVDSGEKAVDFLRGNHVDLIVLDMIMDPGMDGLDTYKKILEIYPDQRAIIASGFSETERVKMAQFLGAGAYIKKPYTLEKLGQAVRKELDR